MLALKLLHFFDEDELFNQFAQLRKDDVTVPNESKLLFVQHSHFSRIIYVRRLTFIRVQGLFYMFFTFYKSSGMFESFSITFSVFRIMTLAP